MFIDNSDSSTLTALIESAQALHSSGRVHQAILLYTQAINHNPHEPHTYHLRGAAYLETQQYHPALADFNEAIKLAPYNEIGYWGRGQVFEALNDHHWAAVNYSRAMDVADDPTIYETDYTRTLTKARQVLANR